MTLKSIDEAATDRLARRFLDDGCCFAVISCDGAPDLKRDVRGRGFCFAEYVAKWAENGDERKARAMLIPGIRLEKAIEIGRKHGRQTVVYKYNDETVCAEYCAAPFGGHPAGDEVATYDVDKNDPLNVRLLHAVFSGGAPLDRMESFRLYERELINTRLGFTERPIGMSGLKWALSIRTSLPGKREATDDVKTSFFVFDRFEDARAVMREKLRGFAYGESNAIFDGEGHIRELWEYTEWAVEYAERTGTDPDFSRALKTVQDALAAALAGEDAAMPHEDCCADDGAAGFEVDGNVLSVWGEDRRLLGVWPILKTNILDMTEDRDYYLHAVVEYGREDCTAVLFVDLKRAEN